MKKNGLISTSIYSNTAPALTPDFMLSVAMGLVEGASIVNKFGQVTAMPTDTMVDVWDVGGEYPYPTDGTAPITNLISDSVDDTMDIEVQGLDINGALVIQTITMTGTTEAALDTNLWRVFRLKNVGSTDNAGNITAEDASNVVYAKIQFVTDIGNPLEGNNQTLMALYTIPAGYTGFLHQFGFSAVGTAKDYNISGEVRMRPYGSVYQLKTTFGISTIGTSAIQRPLQLQSKIPEKTDIRIRATSDATNTGAINSTFDILLLENTVWSL